MIKGSKHTHKWKWSIEARRKLSLKCKGRPSSFKGKKHTEIAKEKMRQKKIGTSMSIEIKNKLKGRHFSPNTEFKKGRFVPFGELSPGWRGGVAVNNKCIECNKKIWWGAKRCQKHNLLLLAKERKESGFFKGANNPNWKGGITPLINKIRTLSEMKQWSKKVFKKDNYICQSCGEKRYIVAHHIKSLSEILSDFLQTYSQFSPIEDKETLVRLAMTYEPFWNIDNGETLCRNCHKNIKIKRSI